MVVLSWMFVNSIHELRYLIPEYRRFLITKQIIGKKLVTGFLKGPVIEWFEKQKNGDGSGNKTNNNPPEQMVEMLPTTINLKLQQTPLLKNL